MTKSRSGHFFEDFRLGQRLAHATPRTLTPLSRSASSNSPRPQPMSTTLLAPAKTGT